MIAKEEEKKRQDKAKQRKARVKNEMNIRQKKEENAVQVYEFCAMLSTVANVLLNCEFFIFRGKNFAQTCRDTRKYRDDAQYDLHITLLFYYKIHIAYRMDRP